MPTNKPKPVDKGFTQLQGIKGIRFSSFTWLLFSSKVVDENVRQGFSFLQNLSGKSDFFTESKNNRLVENDGQKHKVRYRAFSDFLIQIYTRI